MTIEMSDAVLEIPEAAVCPEPPDVVGLGCTNCLPLVPGCKPIPSWLAPVISPIVSVANAINAAFFGTCDEQAPACTSCHPVRYGTGEVVIKADDLPGANGYGLPWGISRSFSSRLRVHYNYGIGENWQLEQWPHIALAFNDNELRKGGLFATAFRGAEQTTHFQRIGDGPEYAALNGSRERLFYAPGSRTYYHWLPDRTITAYEELSVMFAWQHDPAGNEIRVTEWAENQFNPKTVRRTCQTPGGEVVESFGFEYDDESDHRPLMVGAVLSRDDTPISRVNYTYYDGSNLEFGAERDLRTAETQLWVDEEWVSTGTSYYRYWTDESSSSSSSSSSSQSSGGSPNRRKGHLVKFVLKPASFDRLRPIRPSVIRSPPRICSSRCTPIITSNTTTIDAPPRKSSAAARRLSYTTTARAASKSRKPMSGRPRPSRPSRTDRRTSSIAISPARRCCSSILV